MTGLERVRFLSLIKPVLPAIKTWIRKRENPFGGGGGMPGGWTTHDRGSTTTTVKKTPDGKRGTTGKIVPPRRPS
ncbi:hypothetical protein A2954_03465 [Candidatus Roizmanbacteria bacterium RIFCSPLOWO2_01_FULL_37_12]|uniref:Uncharacterized protein n=1 Tax=Candidatus Roizmanbacteria bacterium RIFCSPLOWO2_01_FULL_37_12 TaxID=1802056 RepID=A0A1F7IF96_9BACT|nr:MAG: hypothetical protein A3D76_01300 [Candidatus Roizmanbacteria bacterium RIFCSPHIGHO2_02_FULL_37_9b]OGK42025.1 MAG: hypothetical protein A2954_03465 [Candidatus Roizmanbacteria bacterium RIFCSPLOWO2_01_FULL_37_12]